MTSPETIVLPGLTDMHVHPRGMADTHKENFESASMAAIAGGITEFHGMPNDGTDDPGRPNEYRTVTHYNLARKIAHATYRLYADAGFYYEYKPELDNIGSFSHVVALTSGIKFYIEPTTGNDNEYEPVEFKKGAEEWHKAAWPTQPIVVHAEKRIIEPTLAMIAGEVGHPTHVAHVSNRIELEAVMKAKAAGWPVTCGVTPHHLFLDQDDQKRLGWYARMKPQLGDDDDREFLWTHIDDIDVFETDHAPHADSEKDRANQENPDCSSSKERVKCYGVPGLEAMLPLLLHAVKQGKLTPQQLVDKTSKNPARILGRPIDPGSSVTVLMEDYEFPHQRTYSKATYPYMGRLVTGKVIQVDLHGRTVYQDGEFMTQPLHMGGKTPEQVGFGRVVTPGYAQL